MSVSKTALADHQVQGVVAGHMSTLSHVSCCKSKRTVYHYSLSVP